MVGNAVETVVRSSAERNDETHSAEKTRKKWTRAVNRALLGVTLFVSMLDRASVEIAAGSVKAQVDARCDVEAGDRSKV